MVEITTYDSWEDAQRDIERAMRSADARIKPWQNRIKPGDCVLSMAEGELVFSEVLESYTEDRMRGFRFVRSHSVFVGDAGELGDLHVCQALRVLTKEEFEYARDNSWQLSAIEDGGVP
jgi:hypothetical protein